jgi:hypothetical protein
MPYHLGIDGHIYETEIVDYHLAIKDFKLPFSVSIGSNQRKVCHFCFLFAANKWKLPFSFSFVFCLQNSGNIDTNGHTDRDMETRRHGDGDIEKWRRRHETWEHAEMDTWRHGDIDMET